MAKHNRCGNGQVQRIGFSCLLYSLFLGFIFTGCANPSGGGGDTQLTDLQRYQAAGAGVVARKWTENYDCSNFSTQFYQNCYNAGLPCRVRAGQAGSDFSSGRHSWNSVKIDGKWVNWEPQSNKVYNDHKQTKTQMAAAWGNFFEEDIVRIIYENVGKYVPESVIDAYEIDAYWNDNSPFYQYFIPVSYCLSDDISQNALVLFLKTQIFANNSGDMFISSDRQHLLFFFKYNNKYYGIENMEEQDPIEGRSVMKRNSLKEIIGSDTGFTRLNIKIGYGVE